MMWLKIDVVGLPRVLRRRTALPTTRAPNGCLDGRVKYPDAHVEYFPLPDGQFVMAVLLVLLRLCENIMARSIIPGNVEIL